MKLTPTTINRFLLAKLPSAWFCGVRLKSIDDKTCTVSVKHRWINQNPFKSMYFAVQNMAAELSTGALVMKSIKDSNTKVSMLVVKASSEYYKKATGRITFTCKNGALVSETIANAIRDKEGKTMTLDVVAINEEGTEVSTFQFTWSVKPKA
jgi:hypothetical protein